MNKYLEDPVLNLTATTLRVLRWLAWAFVAVSALITAMILLVALLPGENLDLARGEEWHAALFIAFGVPLFGVIAIFLELLRKVVLSVGEGQPLTVVNAGRLRSMGWLVLALQAAVAVVAIIVGISKDEPIADIDGVYDVIETILIAAVLFILARVFDHGARMQEELEGTV